MIHPRHILTRSEYDLCVIGGGINGAAIAHMAARQGLSVALVEKGDFASGTSSRSSKLMHGGIRYLENFELDLVAEALRERSIQLHNVPHLVRPLPFVIPVYRNSRRPRWMMRLGVALYDLLAGRHRIGRHRSLDAQELSTLVPGLVREGLEGGVLYYDAQMDDARLCLENVLSARQNGAHVANYTEVTAILKESGRAAGVEVRDVLMGESFPVRARRIVCAAGPWAQRFLAMDDPAAPQRLRATKGVHVLLRQQVSGHAIVLQTEDGRVFFVIPWEGHSLIGTTDTDFVGDPDRVEAEEKDITYLRRDFQRFFPGARFEEEDIVAVFAGLRPLVARSSDDPPSKVSRKHIIEETASGMVFVMGGKYTTYRAIAEDCLRKVRPDLHPFPSGTYPLYGSGEMDAPEGPAARYGLDIQVIKHLQTKYGIRYSDVLQLTEGRPQLKERLCACHWHIEAEVAYAVEVEMARTAEDILWRRLGAGYAGCPLDSYNNCADRHLSNR